MMTTNEKTTRQSGVKLRLQSKQGTLYVIKPGDQYTPKAQPQRQQFKYISTGHVNSTNMAISNFHIQLDSNETLNPGDEISGQVMFDVWSNVDVKCVEFFILGRGTVRIFSSSSTFVEKPRNEVYVNNRIQLIGPQNGGIFVTLKPGRYVSAFSYTLPENIPPSVHHNEMGHGNVFDISYYVQANVCDNVASKLSAVIPNMTKIIKAVRKPFTVVLPYNLKSYPGAMETIVHKEHISLMCSSSNDPTAVTLNLNRGVFEVGEAITIKTQVYCPERRRVHSIKAELEQQITFNKDMLSKLRQTMVSAQDDRHLRIFIGQENTMRSQFKLYIPKNLVPSYLPNCQMINMEYNMKLTVSFKKFGGKLVIRVPLVIMPAGQEEYHNGSDEPLFNKPVMKFHQHSLQPHLANGDSNNLHLNDIKEPNKQAKGQITTKYEPALSCLGCCLACLGIGIYDTE